MKEEKKLILELLEEKRISKEQALNLLEAINAKEHGSKTSGIEQELKKFGKTVDKSFTKLSKKANKTYKKYEPTINDVAEKTMNKAKDIYGDISKTIKKDKDIFDDVDDIFEYDDFKKEDFVNKEQEELKEIQRKRRNRRRK